MEMCTELTRNVQAHTIVNPTHTETTSQLRLTIDNNTYSIKEEKTTGQLH